MKGLRLTEEEFARIKGRTITFAKPITENVRIDLYTAGVAGLAAPKPTPKERMQALGRLPKGTMNKTETAYAAYLDAQRSLGHVLWFRFEGIKLRLADSTFYDTDFVVMVASGQLEVHEVKGFMTDDANVKLKVAASQYPFVFRLIRKGKGGAWDIREV